MIFQITYPSGEYMVKGYLAFPPTIAVSAEQVQSQLETFYSVQPLPVVTIACSLAPKQVELSSVKLAAFIYCRGGIGRVGRVKIDWLEQFASCGSVVFAPCYRGNEGGTGRDEFGGAEQEDVLSGYRFLQSLSFIDAAHISIMGFSRGAINAAQAAIALPHVRALVLWGGVSDLANTYEERMDLRRMLKRVIGGTPTKLPESYAIRSPLLLAEHIPCPVLIMHGTADAQVHVRHGDTMYERLLALHHPVDMHRYEGLGHHLPPSVHVQAIWRMFQWIASIT